MAIKAPSVMLNNEYIKSIGLALCEARERSATSIPEMADKLLLSKDQIAGLERYDLKKFYGERHFAQALIKYAEFLNQPVERNQLTLHGNLTVGAIDIATTKAPPSTPPVIEQPDTSNGFAALSEITRSKLQLNTASLPLEVPAATPKKPTSGNLFLYGIAAAGIIGIVLVMQLGLRPVETLATTTQTTPSATPVANVEPVSDLTSDKALIEIAPKNEPHVVLTTNNTCWIQLNHADGKSSQKVYPSNSKLEFARGELSGIIISNLNAATLLVNNEKVTLAQYQKPDSKVARILGQDGSKLLGK